MFLICLKNCDHECLEFWWPWPKIPWFESFLVGLGLSSQNSACAWLWRRLTRSCKRCFFVTLAYIWWPLKTTVVDWLAHRQCDDFSMLFLLSSYTRSGGGVMTLPCYFFSSTPQDPEVVWWLCHVIYSLQLHKSRAKSAEWTSSCVRAVTSAYLPATSVMGKSTVRTDRMRSAAVSGNMDMISFSWLRWSWIQDVALSW